MNTVWKIQLAHAADAFKDKGDEHCLIFLGQITKDRCKFFGIVLSHVRWHSHAGENHFRLWVFLFRPIDDRLKIFACGFHR